jgi:hypothetical protein
MTKKIYVYDIETLSNCFTYTAMDIDTKQYYTFTIWNDVNELDSLTNHLNSCKGLIGFNNISFDYPVLHYILNNLDDLKTLSAPEIATLIYAKAQEVISNEFSSIKPKYVKIPQLDLFKIWHYDNKARMTSLKKLQIALRYDNVQDMPYKHYEIIKTKEQVKEILDYNINDVESTYQFYLKTKPKIELRRGLYQRYGLTCMNYSDSKIGEELMLKLYCDKTNEEQLFIKKQRTPRESFKFKDCIPSYVNFKTDEFKGVKDYLEKVEVSELKDSFKYSFDYNGFRLDLGTGGIHGCIKAGVYESNDEYVIADIDVSSLYPSLAIVNGLYPEHLGVDFLNVYENELLKPRLEAKKRGDKIMDSGFKLSLNSVYGKSNSEFSWLYDPLYTLKTTLAGQLSLCMLSEILMTSVKDITILQVNTDGLTAIIPITEKRNFYNKCVEWENKTKLKLEYQTYSKMIIRDVNNYMAITPNGKVKYKGAFKIYEEVVKEDEYHKSLSQTIVPKAISNFYLHNIPIEETIKNEENIYEFCKTFNTSHGWSCETVDNKGVIISQQKTNRYFISTDGVTFRKTKEDKIIEIEAGGNLVTIFNKYCKKNAISCYNINFSYYIAECYKIIHRIDGTTERIEEENRLEREKIKKERQEGNFLKYCINKQPTQRQYDLYTKDWLIEKYGKPIIK